MPKLAIMAVLAYQAACEGPVSNLNNLIDSGLQDNYSLAVAALKPPGIASLSISTPTCNTSSLSETLSADFVFDNDITTYG
jgi:hypothetical protein